MTGRPYAMHAAKDTIGTRSNALSAEPRIPPASNAIIMVLVLSAKAAHTSIQEFALLVEPCVIHVKIVVSAKCAKMDLSLIPTVPAPHVVSPTARSAPKQRHAMLVSMGIGRIIRPSLRDIHANYAWQTACVAKMGQPATNAKLAISTITPRRSA